MTSYPNLELLEYKAKQLLAQDEEFLAAVEAYKKENHTKYACFDVNEGNQILVVCHDQGGNPAKRLTDKLAAIVTNAIKARMEA